MSAPRPSARDRLVSRTLAAGAILLLGACAIDVAPDGPSRVSIKGAVYSDFLTDLPCAEQAGDQTRPEELSGIVLTFTDAEGDVVGETTTDPLHWQDLDYGCRFLASYSVTVDQGISYSVEFDPPSPRVSGGAYYDGAEQLEAQQISHEDLVAAGFEWNFEAPPQFVVP